LHRIASLSCSFQSGDSPTVVTASAARMTKRADAATAQGTKTQ
jgi:hypothetical protein